jgi:hypothetical protein
MVVNKPKKSNRIEALVIVLAIGIVVAVTAVSSFPAATVTTEEGASCTYNYHHSRV